VLPFAREVFVGADRRFLEAVDEAMATRHDERAAEARRRRVRAHTWDDRLQAILAALREADAKSTAVPRALAAR
jgi:hypothetical protein